MAKILRGLDMLAGEAGRVMYGENARKEQLLAGVQQRSQQDYLQGQRQQHQESMQNKRIFSTLQNAQAKLLQDNNQFKEELDYKKGRDEAEMGLSMKRLGELKRQNNYSQGKAERDKVAKEFEFFDESLGQLNDKYRSLLADPLASPQERDAVKNQLEQMEMSRALYWKQTVNPEVQNVITEGQVTWEAIRQKRLEKMFRKFTAGPGAEYQFGNTSYSAPKGTEVDEDFSGYRVTGE